MPRKRKVLTVGEWMELVALVPAELAASSLPLKHAHDKLRGMLGEVQGLVAERDSLEAQKQIATKRINEILVAGGKTATLVRDILREHFGPDSEQLVAFKIQPFRGRKRAGGKKSGSAAPPSSNEPEK